MYFVNATAHDINLKHVARKMKALDLTNKDAVGTTVHVGASGTICGMSSMAWSVRLERAVEACETADGPCVAIMDAPPTTQINAARVALALLRTRIDKLKGTEKLLILSGPVIANYPMLGEHGVTYGDEPWTRVCEMVQWGMHVHLQHATLPNRMDDAFALILGSHITPSGPYTTTATYPSGYTLPLEVLPYMVFSDNVVPGSARASTTRGMTADTIDGQEWCATVVLASDSTQETDLTREFRVLLTSDICSRAAGGAYFALCKMGTALPPFVRRAMKDVHMKVAGTYRLPPVPLCRVASHTCH